MNYTPVRTEQKMRLKRAMQEMLARTTWTHMVTLAFNDPETSLRRAQRSLKNWDARLSRVLLGSRWLNKPDERLNWVAFLEHPRHNPHWHLLVQALPAQFADLEDHADRVWLSLVPSGSTDVRLIYCQSGAIRYVTKQLPDPDCYASFCRSFDFIRVRA